MADDENDNFDYDNSNRQLVIVSNFIEGISHLEKMMEMQNKAETIAPFLDPTLYMKKSQALRIDKERTQIIYKAQQALIKLRKDNA